MLRDDHHSLCSHQPQESLGRFLFYFKFQLFMCFICLIFEDFLQRGVKGTLNRSFAILSLVIIGIVNRLCICYFDKKMLLRAVLNRVRLVLIGVVFGRWCASPYNSENFILISKFSEACAGKKHTYVWTRVASFCAGALYFCVLRPDS